MMKHQLPEEPQWVLPYMAMEVGDSFFIPTMRPAKLMYIIDTSAKKYGIKVKSYITTEEGYYGIRTWRLG
jgi:hypothetical protein